MKRRFQLINQLQNEHFEISKIQLNKKPAYIVEAYSLEVKFESYNKALRFVDTEKRKNKINTNNELKDLDNYNFLNIPNPKTGSNELFYIEIFGGIIGLLFLLFAAKKLL